MDLTPGAKEILRRADGFQRKTENREMCIEHLFYGMVSFMLESEPDPEYADEHAEVAEYLNGKLVHPTKIEKKIREAAKTESRKFRPANPVFRFATRTAKEVERERYEACAMDLTVALTLYATPVTSRFLNQQVNMKKAAEDYLEEHGVYAVGEDDTEDDTEYNTVYNTVYDEESDDEYYAPAVRNWVKKRERKPHGKVSFFKWFEQQRDLSIWPNMMGDKYSYKDLLNSILLIPLIVILAMEGLGIFLNKFPIYVAIETVVVFGMIMWKSNAIASLFSAHSDAKAYIIKMILRYAWPFFFARALSNAFGWAAVPLGLRITSFFILLVLMLFGKLFQHAIASERLVMYIKDPLYVELADAESRAGSRFLFMMNIGTGIGALIWVLSLPMPSWLIKVLILAAWVWIWLMFSHVQNILYSIRYYTVPIAPHSVFILSGAVQFLSIPAAVLIPLALVLGWSGTLFKVIMAVSAMDIILAVFAGYKIMIRNDEDTMHASK